MILKTQMNNLKNIVCQSEGRLEYGPGMRAVVWVDQDISNLYRKLIPKYYYPQPQMYNAHITVVRTSKESVKDLSSWNKYNGEIISFEYERYVNFDGIYFYLNVFSDRIGEIRQELGLPRFRFGELGSAKGCYHISIANCKRQK